jgi:ABC-2 type transport system permease protein
VTSEWRQLKAFYENYLQFCINSRALLIPVAVLALLVLWLQYSLSSGTFSPFPPDAAYFAGGIMGIIPIIVAISASSLGGFAVANDYVFRASTFIFSLPARRRTVFLGRYLAALTVGVLVVAAYYVYAAAATAWYYGTVPPTMLASLLLSSVYVGSAIAVAFMASALLRSERGALFLTIIVMLFGLPFVQGVLERNNINPIGVLTYAGFTVMKAISSGGPIFSINLVNLDLSYPVAPNIFQGFLVMAAYLAVALVLGLVIYAKSEIT